MYVYTYMHTCIQTYIRMCTDTERCDMEGQATSECPSKLGLACVLLLSIRLQRDSEMEHNSVNLFAKPKFHYNNMHVERLSNSETETTYLQSVLSTFTDKEGKTRLSRLEF